MIGPVLIGLGLLVLAIRDIARLRWRAWHGEPLQVAGLIGLAVFIGGVLLTLAGRT